MNPDTGPCQYLEWDTQFFGSRIARMNASRLTPSLMQAALDWCSDEAIDCLYFLADSDDPQTIWLAEEQSFKLVEVRYTLERSLKDWNPETRPRTTEGVFVRPVQSEDIRTLQDIARTCYVDSRFYFDPHFRQDLWGSYYATWVKNSCEGGADLALVAEKDAAVVGYITGLIDKQTNQAVYELTGVRESARRSGVGQELFRSGLDWYVQHGIQEIWVATQGRNVTTQRMIQRHGFLSKSCQLYYHKWFER
jgi:dTDP-4-amino-4,6-dideoxy-D-galactose acyltransferase